MCVTTNGLSIRSRLYARLAYRDLNGNAEMDKDDCYGISGWPKELYARFINGSGVRFISTDENGYPSFDLSEGSDRNQRAADAYL